MKRYIPLLIFGWFVAFALSSTGIYMANNEEIEPPLAGVFLWIICTVPIFAMLMIHRGMRTKSGNVKPMAMWEVHINAAVRAGVVLIVTTIVLLLATRAWLPDHLSEWNESLYVVSVFIFGMAGASLSYRNTLRRLRSERSHIAHAKDKP